MTFTTAVPIYLLVLYIAQMCIGRWSVIHGIKRKPHLSVVWNWYHFVAIAILHKPRPTDSADINTRLQLSDTSSIPPMHGGFLLSPCLSVCPSVCRRHGFRSISQVCFGISISNFICMLMVAIGRSLLIFSDVTFKMAAWLPYWIFWFPDSTLLWLWISTSNFSGTILMYMGRSLLIFSNVIFKMAAWRPY